MTTLMSVVVQVLVKPSITIGSGDVFFEIDLLVFDRSPKSFDHHVVDHAAFSVHANGNVLAICLCEKAAAK